MRPLSWVGPVTTGGLPQRADRRGGGRALLLEKGPAHGPVAALPTGHHIFTARPVDGCHPSCPQSALEHGAAEWCDMRALLGAEWVRCPGRRTRPLGHTDVLSDDSNIVGLRRKGQTQLFAEEGWLSPLIADALLPAGSSRGQCPSRGSLFAGPLLGPRPPGTLARPKVCPLLNGPVRSEVGETMAASAVPGSGV